jgi:hypothetical protein
MRIKLYYKQGLWHGGFFFNKKGISSCIHVFGSKSFWWIIKKMIFYFKDSYRYSLKNHQPLSDHQ